MQETKNIGDNQNDSYVAGNSEDPVFFGAKNVIDAELKIINKKQL